MRSRPQRRRSLDRYVVQPLPAAAIPPHRRTVSYYRRRQAVRTVFWTITLCLAWAGALIAPQFFGLSPY